jgi:ligand-binding SRPBCC domain-containing protein
MMTIELVNQINAPIELVFDLSTDIDVELASAKSTLRAIAGVTSGRIRLGERVTWSSRQYAIEWKHTTEITALERPTYMRDEMVAGAFRSLRHDHFFEAAGSNVTVMRDHLIFAAPLFVLGTIAERLFLRRRLLKLLTDRNATIKQIAESTALQQGHLRARHV